MTRGLALHNPMNLTRSGIAWDGLASEQPDPELCAFVDDLHGLRAGMLNFLDMEKFHNLTSIGDCIERASPPPQNPTAQYIANVCEWCNATADTPIRSVLLPFFHGIVRQEQGIDPFPDSLYAQALASAEAA